VQVTMQPHFLIKLFCHPLFTFYFNARRLLVKNEMFLYLKEIRHETHYHKRYIGPSGFSVGNEKPLVSESESLTHTIIDVINRSKIYF